MIPIYFLSNENSTDKHKKVEKVQSSVRDKNLYSQTELNMRGKSTPHFKQFEVRKKVELFFTY